MKTHPALAAEMAFAAIGETEDDEAQCGLHDARGIAAAGAGAVKEGAGGRRAHVIRSGEVAWPMR